LGVRPKPNPFEWVPRPELGRQALCGLFCLDMTPPAVALEGGGLRSEHLRTDQAPVLIEVDQERLTRTQFREFTVHTDRLHERALLAADDAEAAVTTDEGALDHLEAVGALALGGDRPEPRVDHQMPPAVEGQIGRRHRRLKSAGLDHELMTEPARELHLELGVAAGHLVGEFTPVVGDDLVLAELSADQQDGAIAGVLRYHLIVLVFRCCRYRSLRY